MAKFGSNKVEYGTPISVVMPVYNRAHLMPRVAGSILAQTYPHFELLIVDDASSDDIEGAVAALNDPRVRLVKRDQNGGVGAARNTGVEAAKHPLVAFHDSDDYCTADRLELSMQALSALSETYIGVYGARLIYNEVEESNYRRADVQVIPRPDAGPFSGDLAARTQRGNIINFPTLLVKREALLAAGPSDPLLRKNVDWDLCLRLTEQGHIGFVPDPLILTPTSLNPKVSANRVSRSARQGARSMIRISGKIRRKQAQGFAAALSGHYASAGRSLMHVDRPVFARKFFAASLGLSFAQPKIWMHYAMSHLPGLHARMRQSRKI